MQYQSTLVANSPMNSPYRAGRPKRSGSREALSGGMPPLRAPRIATKKQLLAVDDSWFVGWYARASLMFMLLVTAGCAFQVGPDYRAPMVSDEWRQSVQGQLDERDAALHAWWMEFDDPVLNELIEKAHADSNSLRIATARLKEAQAFVGVIGSARFPDLIAEGGGERGEVSEGSLGIPTVAQTRRNAGFRSFWEWDLWGRVSRSVQSAEASYAASVEDVRDVLVLTYAAIGATYLDLRTLQERLSLANANVELQRETFSLVQARNKAQLAPDLELQQAISNLALTESVVPELETAILLSIHQLSVLVGEPPAALMHLLVEPQLPPDLPDSFLEHVPIDVVRQRPDVRRSERQLAAQTERIGIAKAELYPQLSLGGNFGASTTTGSLFRESNRDWGLGGGVSWNLFNGGRIRSLVRVEEARTEQALIAYEESVLRALREVEDALIQYTKGQDRADAIRRSVLAAQEADVLVRDLYRSGLTDFQNVLDTQRSLFAQQDLLAEVEGLVLQSLVAAYRAFGGGWGVYPIVDMGEGG